MRAGDVTRNRKTQARAAFVNITRFIKPHKRLEHIGALLFRDSRPIVINMNE